MVKVEYTLLQFKDFEKFQEIIISVFIMNMKVQNRKLGYVTTNS